MKYHKNLKPWLCASTDKSRNVITETYLDITEKDGQRNGNLVAVDGAMLVVIPVELDARDQPGHVSKSVFEAARKICRKAIDMAQVVLGRETATLDDVSQQRRMGERINPGDRFPNWRQVDIAPDKIPTEHSIAFDAKRLAKMAEAMGCDGVTISFADELSAIYVKPNWNTGCNLPEAEPNAHGVLMPIRMS